MKLSRHRQLSAHKIHIRPCINESFVAAAIHAMHSLNEREKKMS